MPSAENDDARPTDLRRLRAASEGFALRGLFAEDAIWTVPGRRHDGRRPRGRDADLPLPRPAAEGDRTARTARADRRAGAPTTGRGALPRVRQRRGRRLDLDQVLLFRLEDGFVHRGARAPVRPCRRSRSSGRPTSADSRVPWSADDERSAVAAGRPTVRIRGTAYPVLLPTLRDPRLHLAAVIVTLQVLGQTAFDFRLSIAQILVSLLTCAVLEVGIAFRRQRVLMWPASALLTGNGVAFVLRVPGTEHGDWWSMHGWWIFAGTAAVALLSKYVITFRGRHIFNPSNFGLVLCFLLLGPERADPLAFWWGPMSVWLALALVLIVGGGLAILRRLRLVAIAVGFWLTFAAGIAVLAASGHEMTARLAPRPDRRRRPLVAARHLARDPRLPLLHDHRPADDPDERTRGRRVYAVSVGFLASLLIAPWTTRVRAQARGARRAHARLRRAAAPAPAGRGPRGAGAELRAALAPRARAGAQCSPRRRPAALLVLAGLPARPEARSPPRLDRIACHR